MLQTHLSKLFAVTQKQSLHLLILPVVVCFQYCLKELNFILSTSRGNRLC